MIYLMAASLGSNLRNLIDDLFESWPKIASNGSTFAVAAAAAAAADAAAHVNVRDADTDLNICPDMILIRKFRLAVCCAIRPFAFTNAGYSTDFFRLQRCFIL